MSQSAGQIYLISGANRGIGLALVDTIASRDSSSFIYAGARDPAGATELKALVSKYPGRIETFKYVSGDKEGNNAIAQKIKEKHGHVDTVIANAGIANYLGKVQETPIEKFTEHFDVNILGPIVLFQSVYDLLKASQFPRFIPITSRGGSLGLIQAGDTGHSPYGASKAALNWVTRKIHFENEWLVAYPQCPGAVDTDMSQNFINLANDEELRKKWTPFMRAPNVAAGLVLDILTASTREKDGGQFHSAEGESTEKVVRTANHQPSLYEFTLHALAKEIGAKHGHVDTVIANAETPVEKLTEHFDVSVLGPIVLFQSGLAYPQCPGAVDTNMSEQYLAMANNEEITKYMKSIVRTPDVAMGLVLDILIASTREKDGGQFHNVEGDFYGC